MKPTTEQAIELAREAGVLACGHSFDPDEVASAERLVHLALERFGAGGGESVAWLHPDWPNYKGVQSPVTTYMTNGWIPLYTHPSPTDLRAEYLRGLDDAKKEVEQFNVDGVGAIVDAIEALKGKQ